jgi:hypothetical protein
MSVKIGKASNNVVPPRYFPGTSELRYTSKFV